ncbi:hypothetical protein BHM03_00049033 [Ensete ventricosum]|nr:hypothetical protein BHM03_00049033 [Ensete ventricosum]
MEGVAAIGQHPRRLPCLDVLQAHRALLTGHHIAVRRPAEALQFRRAVVRLTGTEEGGEIARPGSTDGWVRDSSTSSGEEEEEKVEEREVQIGRRSRFAVGRLEGWDCCVPLAPLVHPTHVPHEERRNDSERWVLSGWDIPNPVPSLGLALPDRGPTPETTKGREPRVSIKTGSTYDVIHDIDGDVWVPPLSV